MSLAKRASQHTAEKVSRKKSQETRGQGHAFSLLRIRQLDGRLSQFRRAYDISRYILNNAQREYKKRGLVWRQSFEDSE